MERVFIFIDGSNFYHGLKEEVGKTNIDFLEFVFKLCNNRELIGVNYYNAALKKEYFPEQYKKQQKFFNYIGSLPKFTLKLGHLEFRDALIPSKGKIVFEDSEGRIGSVNSIEEIKELYKEQNLKFLEVFISPTKYLIEKGVDILLASDMLSLAYENIYDTGILVSGDGDFAYVIKKIKHLQKKIEVAYFPKRRCWHLRQISDKFIPLSKNFFRFLNKEKGEETEK